MKDIMSNQVASFEQEGFTYTDEELRHIKELLEDDRSWDEKIQAIVERIKNNGV